MPIALRRYVTTVAIVGPLLTIGVAVFYGGGLGRDEWGRAFLLLVLAAVTFGRPLDIGHKYSYDVTEVVHLAIVLLFPPPLPGLMVVLASGLHVVRRRSWSVPELFNVGQAATYVTAGALCLAAFREWAGAGPSFAGLAPVSAIAATAIAMLCVNVGLVAGAISLETGARFWRLWRGEVASVGRTYVALIALGLVAALVVRDYPLAMVALVLPAGLAQYSLRREVQLRAETRAALAALVDVIELRDPYTAGHSERVAALARGLAARLGLTGEEVDLIETAGRVHDLGKVALAPSILEKRGALDETEWNQMREHPDHGAAVVAQFVGYRACADLVRHHHERWDGGGYPDGLATEDIPFGARILAVADTFDALTTGRPYRAGAGPDSAVQILLRGAGTQWDARVVDALVEHQRETAVASRPVAVRPVPA